LREIAQEPPFWRWFSFGWHGLLYYNEVQKISKDEHDPSPKNQSGSILVAGDGFDGAMGARRYQAGMNSKRKRVLVQLEWGRAKPGANQKREIECVGQATGWKVGKGSPGG